MTDRPSDPSTANAQAVDGAASTEPSRDRPETSTDVSTGARPDEPDAGELGPQATDADRDLLARARAVGDLDLAARPDEFEELDSVIVDRLRAIEDL